MTLQQQKIYDLLRQHTNAWVSLPSLMALGVAQYNSRILDLRRMGYIIENRTQVVNGVKHSWYRLVVNVGEQEKFDFADMGKTKF